MRARGAEIPSPETLAKVFRAPLSEVKAKLELAGESSNRAWSQITRTFLSESTESFLTHAIRWNIQFRLPERQVESLNPDEVAFETDLVTDFHHRLVNSDFLEKLRRHFRANPYGRHSKISARLFSIYNEDRYMGPQSVVKYRFEVHLRVSPSDYVLSRLIRMEVEFRPKLDGFVCRGLRQGFVWNREALGQALVEESLMSAAAWKRQIEEFERLELAYEWAGIVSIVTHLLRENAVNENDLLQLVTGRCDLPLADDSRLVAAQRSSGFRREELTERGWLLETDDPPTILVGKLGALEAIEHLYGEYREVYLCEVDSFRAALASRDDRSP